MRKNETFDECYFISLQKRKEIYYSKLILNNFYRMEKQIFYNSRPLQNHFISKTNLNLSNFHGEILNIGSFLRFALSSFIIKSFTTVRNQTNHFLTIKQELPTNR